MSNVINLSIDQGQYFRRRILAMYRNGDYTTPKLPFHLHFNIDGKEYVLGPTEK